MNTRVDLERSVGAWLRAAAGDASPDYLDEIVDRVVNVGQRPWWSSPRGWLPMNSPVTRTFGFRPIRLLILLVALLIVAALIAVAIGGGRPSLPELTGLAPSGPPAPSSTAVGPSPDDRSGPPVASLRLPTPSTGQPAPASGSWSATGSMARSHTFGATTTLLTDGRVLVAGGETAGSGGSSSRAADLYDPATGQWAPTGNMLYPRHGHSATLLADGRVLVAGGWNYGGPAPASEELYDPSTGTWTATGAMIFSGRHGPVAVSLADGRVLVAGGCCSHDGGTRRAELYDPATGTWRSIPPTAAPADSAARLADGRVLVMEGGAAPEIFDPVSTHWTNVARPPSAGGQATLLRNGEVLVQSGELYDPTRDNWATTGDPATGRGRAALLGDGTVLVVGETRSARYDPGSGSWSPVARPPLPVDYAMASAEGVHVDVLITLADGRVLATEVGSAVLFDPAAGPG